MCTLPLVLAKELGLILVPTMGFICWALLGIQEIGLLIEDPFQTILKLNTICMSIQKDVQQTLDSSLSSQMAKGLDEAAREAEMREDVEEIIDASFRC